MREVASGAKRNEDGARTTGAFGVGFISVYQITDQPEIHSAGRRWVLRPDNQEHQRIEEVAGFFDHRRQRNAVPDAVGLQSIKDPPRAQSYPRSMQPTLIRSWRNSGRHSLGAILFLKQIRKIELHRNGVPVCRVTRELHGDCTVVNCDGASQRWRVFGGTFRSAAVQLRAEYGDVIEASRSSDVRVAVSDSTPVSGLLFATLPTEQSTGLPFHIDADFFPASDRKSIAFGDSYDPRSEWNRTALKAAASVVAANLIRIRDTFGEGVGNFWRFLDRLYGIHSTTGSDERIPLKTFWQSLAAFLPSAPIVHSESGKWLKPAEVRIPTGRAERERGSSLRRTRNRSGEQKSLAVPKCPDQP